MTTLREAAQQALEALVIGSDAAHEVAQNYHEAMAGYRPARHIAVDDDVRKIEAAITALRAALAEPVQTPHLFPLQSDRMRIDPVTGNVGIGTPSAEPVQEPVAWMHTDPDNTFVCFLEWRENEPSYRGSWIKTPLYTAPPQRKPLVDPAEYDDAGAAERYNMGLK